MASRTVQLVLHYDGSRFFGWQRQVAERTVQGVLEEVLERLCTTRVSVIGAGRTDSGVHARGQAAGVRVAERWEAASLRRAMNALLPPDVWVAQTHLMRDDFHARYSAVARRYRYYVGLDDEADSPFRRPYEYPYRKRVDLDVLHAAAAALIGDRCFRAFAVKGTAPADDDHRCIVSSARWLERQGGLCFEIEANRFLHHMVRFLVGTMLDMAVGRRPPDMITQLLGADSNEDVSPPAPANGLFLEQVTYPEHFYQASA